MKTDEIAVCQMFICTLRRLCLRACGVRVGCVWCPYRWGNVQDRLGSLRMFSHFIKTM